MEHEFIDNLDSYEMVLVAAGSAPVEYNQDSIARAFQIQAFEDRTMLGDESPSFAHNETGVVVRCDGNILAVDAGNDDFLDVLDDLFRVLIHLDWTSATLYHAASSIDEFKRIICGKIPASSDFEIHAVKTEVGTTREVEEFTNEMEGVSGTANVNEDDAIVLAGMRSFNIPEDPPKHSASTGRNPNNDDDGESFLVAGPRASVVVENSASHVQDNVRSSNRNPNDDEDDTPRVFAVTPMSSNATYEVYGEDEDAIEIPSGAAVWDSNAEADLPVVNSYGNHSSGEEGVNIDMISPVNPLPVVFALNPNDIEEEQEQFNAHVEEAMGVMQAEGVAEAVVEKARSLRLERTAIAELIAPAAEVFCWPGEESKQSRRDRIVFRCGGVPVGVSYFIFNPRDTDLISSAKILGVTQSNIVELQPGLTSCKMRWNVLGEIGQGSPFAGQRIAEILFQKCVNSAAIAMWFNDVLEANSNGTLRDLNSLDCLGDEAEASARLRALNLIEDSFVDMPKDGNSEWFTVRETLTNPIAKMFVVNTDSLDSSFVYWLKDSLNHVANIYSETRRYQEEVSRAALAAIEEQERQKRDDVELARLAELERAKQEQIAELRRVQAQLRELTGAE